MGKEISTMAKITVTKTKTRTAKATKAKAVKTTKAAGKKAIPMNFKKKGK